MLTYAQNFEDVILARVFGPRASGFYVDVGAADPKRMSVTKWFYDQGWSGINIEPNEALFQRLVSERPRDVNLQCGIGDEPGTAEFAEMPQAELSSFDEAARAASSTAPSLVRRVPVRTLTDVFAEHAAGKAIDFLKIDVEGWERKVLLGLDLKRFHPTVIVMEATKPLSREETRQEWEDILVSAGYAPVYFDGLNWFYLAAENEGLRPLFDLPPNVFDGFTDIHLAEAREHVANLRASLTEVTARLAASEEMLRRYRSLSNWIASRLSLAMSAKNGNPAAAPELSEAAATIRVVEETTALLSSAKRGVRHLIRLARNRARKR